jgi:two-component system sensor histidine kinase HydH
MLAKFIRKKNPEDDLSVDNGRMIYFSKTPIQNTDESPQDQEHQNERDSKSHKLTKSTGEQILIVDSKDNKGDRVYTINSIIEEEKKELSNIQTLIKKQSKSLERAKKFLTEKQMILQRELDRKAFKYSNNEKFTIMGELSSRMAHDIRNPLNVIKVQVDLLKLRYSKQEDKIMLDSLGRMERAVNGITDQLEDILNFLKDSPMQFENVSIMKILNDSLLNIHKPENVLVELPDCDVTVVCDSYKMQRVLTNMIQNSIQAMEDGGTIIVQIFEQNDDIKIEIKDTGLGIPDDALPRIFEPLFTTKRTGTGLGLSICKKIIEDHNGSISVKNNPTTFIITIPKIQQD